MIRGVRELRFDCIYIPLIEQKRSVHTNSEAHLLLQVIREFLNGIGNLTLCPENGNAALPRGCICFVLLDDGVQQIQCFIIPKPQNT